MTPTESRENEVRSFLNGYPDKRAAISAAAEFLKEAALPKVSEDEPLIGNVFTYDDIRDKEKLETLIENEASAIFKTASKGRSFDDVKFSVRQGKIAEMLLVETGRFSFASKKYHDLVNQQGEYVEVKAYDVTSSTAPHVQKDLKRIRTEGWNESSWYYLFQCKYGQYTLLEKIRVR